MTLEERVFSPKGAMVPSTVPTVLWRTAPDSTGPAGTPLIGVVSRHGRSSREGPSSRQIDEPPSERAAGCGGASGGRYLPDERSSGQAAAGAGSSRRGVMPGGRYSDRGAT